MKVAMLALGGMDRRPGRRRGGMEKTGGALMGVLFGVMRRLHRVLNFQGGQS